MPRLKRAVTGEINSTVNSNVNGVKANLTVKLIYLNTRTQKVV
jgi:hypothetical protein